MKPAGFFKRIADNFNRLTGGGRDQHAARGERALYLAVRAGNRSEVRTHLKRGADPNLATENGTTALHEAAYWGEVDIVRLLIAYGADPSRMDAHGWTPLHAAAVSGGMRTRAVIITILMAAGGGDDVVDKHGWTAREYMALWDHHPAAAERLRIMMGRQVLDGDKRQPPQPRKP